MSWLCFLQRVIFHVEKVSPSFSFLWEMRRGIQLVAVSQGKGKESQSWGKSARGENDLQCPAGSLPSS